MLQHPNKSTFLIAVILATISCKTLPQVDDTTPKAYKNVCVHDPSILDAENGQFYVIGSHMASAKTERTGWSLRTMSMM